MLPELNVGFAVVLDFDVGFGAPVGVLRQFVHADCVHQELDAAVGASDDDDGVVGFCNTCRPRDFIVIPGL